MTMASFYNLLKYAATGIASPDMTYYDRLRASTLMGGATVQTLTGIPPLSFKADGTPLISWSMKGNGSQTGTPTPDNPVMPEFVGVSTGNLAEYWKNAYVDANGDVKSNNQNGMTYPIKLTNGQRIVLTYGSGTSRGYAVFESFDGINLSTLIRRATFSGPGAYNATGDCYFVSWLNKNNSDTMSAQALADCELMLNIGDEALPYEPFGYKIPLTCGGTTISVYTGDPLRKALDGSNAVDVLSSEGTITREVDAEGNALATPVTQAVDVPEIPTVKGQNVLTVDTPIQPSEMTLTYKG